MFLSGIYVTFCNLMFKIAFLGKLKLTLDFKMLYVNTVVKGENIQILKNSTDRLIKKCG